MKALKIGCGVVFAGLLLLFAIGLFVEKTIVSEQRKESAARAASPTRKWAINRSRSSFDDSPTVELQLEAETPISGWPAKVETPLLVLRCQEHKTEVAVRTGMSPNVEYGRYDEATVRIRLDYNPAAKIIASESTDHAALFLPEPIPLIRSLLKHERLTFGFTPFNSPPAETEFDLRGLDAAIIPLQEACGWR